jgi:hypothetical protein
MPQLGREIIPAYSPEARGETSGCFALYRSGCRRSWPREEGSTFVPWVGGSINLCVANRFIHNRGDFLRVSNDPIQPLDLSARNLLFCKGPSFIYVWTSPGATRPTRREGPLGESETGALGGRTLTRKIRKTPHDPPQARSIPQ